MSRLFAATEKITTLLTSHATQRSFLIWAYRTSNSFSSSGYPRLWDKRVSSFVEDIEFNADSLKYQYVRQWGVGATWTMDNTPAINEWHPIIVTYDSSSTSNDPIMYLDGVASPITETVAPSGSLTNNTDAYVIGNRGSDNARYFQGYLAEFAVWDRILTAGEAKGLGQGASPLFYPQGLACYVPLIRELTDRKNGVPTASGTTVATHPRIFYPASLSLKDFIIPAGVASSIKVKTTGVKLIAGHDYRLKLKLRTTAAQTITVQALTSGGSDNGLNQSVPLSANSWSEVSTGFRALSSDNNSNITLTLSTSSLYGFYIDDVQLYDMTVFKKEYRVMRIQGFLQGGLFTQKLYLREVTADE